MNTPLIYVDVTTISQWTRPAVGIVRVEQQLCRWLLGNPSVPVKFVVYHRATRHFFEVSPDDLHAHLDQLDHYASAHDQDRQKSLGGQLNRLRQQVLKTVGSLPESSRRPLYALLRRGKPYVLRLLHQVRLFQQRWCQRLPRPALPAPASRESVDLVPGSVYVSLGLDWDTKDMADLYRRKRANDLKMLLFCYDIIPIKLPHLCVADVSRYFGHYFVDLAWCADRVLCISESSRNDLHQFLAEVGAPLPVSHVVRLGADILPQGGTRTVSAQLSALTQTPYILFVSTIERRKNHEILYRAYTRLGEFGMELPNLICVGMQGWGIDELLGDLRLDPRIQGKIHLLNHVNDAELAHLYRNARFTVYPSLYEGWGLPVAESLAYGKFCLCANTASLPEVGEHWVEYLDPWNLPGWVARLNYYFTHPEEVEHRNRAIASGYRPYPWRDTAAIIVGHATELLHGS